MALERKSLGKRCESSYTILDPELRSLVDPEFYFSDSSDDDTDVAENIYEEITPVSDIDGKLQLRKKRVHNTRIYNVIKKLKHMRITLIDSVRVAKLTQDRCYCKINHYEFVDDITSEIGIVMSKIDRMVRPRVHLIRYERHLRYEDGRKRKSICGHGFISGKIMFSPIKSIIRNYQPKKGISSLCRYMATIYNRNAQFKQVGERDLQMEGVRISYLPDMVEEGFPFASVKMNDPIFVYTYLYTDNDSSESIIKLEMNRFGEYIIPLQLSRVSESLYGSPLIDRHGELVGLVLSDLKVLVFDRLSAEEYTLFLTTISRVPNTDG